MTPAINFLACFHAFCIHSTKYICCFPFTTCFLTKKIPTAFFCTALVLDRNSISDTDLYSFIEVISVRNYVAELFKNYFITKQKSYSNFHISGKGEVYREGNNSHHYVDSLKGFSEDKHFRTIKRQGAGWSCCLLELHLLPDEIY